MKRFVFTADVGDTARFISRLIMFLFSAALFLFFVWWLANGGVDTMADWMDMGIELLAKFYEEHKKAIFTVVGTFGFIGVLVLILLDF